jgi:AcrR family transcriptional regulator
MYQYYPNKQALLFAILEQKLDKVEAAMLEAAEKLATLDLETMARALADAWLNAKTKDIEASRAIYGIAAGFDIGERMARGADRLQQAIGRLLATAQDAHFRDVDATAFMTLALLAGSTRAALEHGATKRDLARLRRELPRACYGYLHAVQRETAHVRVSRPRRRCS